MDKTERLPEIKFRSLPSRIRKCAVQSQLLISAQRNFLQSRAPIIDNNAYWAKTGEDFETHKLNDRTLDPHINAFLDKLANTIKSVIEFGCGIGRTASVLRARGFHNYTGVDVCEKAVAIARQRLPEMGFEVGNILTRRANKRFDAAIATDVLLYLSPEDQIRALLNVNKALKKEAQIILRWAPGENNVLIKSKTVGGEQIEGWVFLVTAEYIKELLRLTGFSLVQPIQREAVVINPGNPLYEKQQDYLVILGKKS